MSEGDGVHLGAARLRQLLMRHEFLFLVVGGFNTAVGLAVFTVLEALPGWPVGYLVNLVIAYAVGIVIGFNLHRRFVFRVTGPVIPDFVRYCGVQATSFALNAGLLPALVEWGGLPTVPAQVLALILVTGATYVGHRWFSFRRPTEEAPVSEA